MHSINIDLGDGYQLTSDKFLLQPERVHAYLTGESYWAPAIPYAIFHTSFENSWCVGILYEGEQIAFARLVTDYAVFAYLADVYVLKEHRGKGLSKQMMEVIMGLPFVTTCRRVMLGTLDAHGLYKQYGFNQPAHPERLMEVARQAHEVYGQVATTNV